jgi:hypothetical protein
MSAIVTRAVVFALFVCIAGCATGSVRERFPCPDETLADWPIPAGWIIRELTPVEARVEVATANIAKDAAESRWQQLQDRWREGDRYWFYRRPGGDTINAVGIQEGVVLTRQCDQLGFVTTRIEVEPTTSR